MTQDELVSKFPFLTGIKHNNIDYIGIIENVSDKTVTFYDFSSIDLEEEKMVFLKLGGLWWWETNRQLPIGIYLKDEMNYFNFTIKSFREKDVEILFGPYVSLEEMGKKKFGKKRTIKLVKRCD